MPDSDSTEWTHRVKVTWRDTVTGKRRQKTCDAKIDKEGITFRYPIVAGANEEDFLRGLDPRPSFKISLP